MGKRLSAEQLLEARKSHLAAHVRDMNPIALAGTDIIMWIWQTKKGYPALCMFQGNSTKPIDGPKGYRVYMTVEQRKNVIQRTIENRIKVLEEKAEKASNRKNWDHGFSVGDTLVSSWGHDQTNVDFYQVTKVVGKQIEIRSIRNQRAGQNDHVLPVQDGFVGDAMRKTPQMGYDGKPHVRIHSSSTARLWDGTPRFETPAGMGH